MISVDLLDPTPAKPEQAIAVLKDTILPLYVQYWQEYAYSKYNKEFNPHIQLLLELWFGGGLRFFVARDDGKAVGFAVCIIFRPLQYQATVMQVHDLYDSHNIEVAQALFDYINTTSRVLNCDELWYEEYRNTGATFGSRWIEQPHMDIRRFTRVE